MSALQKYESLKRKSGWLFLRNRKQELSLHKKEELSCFFLWHPIILICGEEKIWTEHIYILHLILLLPRTQIKIRITTFYCGPYQKKTNKN